MRMRITGVAPEEIVLVGEFTRQWKRLGPIIEAEWRPGRSSGMRRESGRSGRVGHGASTRNGRTGVAETLWAIWIHITTGAFAIRRACPRSCT
jgi:hypothetical protein